MHIRPITPQDADEWSRMRTDLWPDTNDGHKAEIAAYFDGTSIDVVEVLVIDREAEAKGLGGFLELNLRNFAEGCLLPEVPYVEAWLVDEDLRNQGWGRSLMQAAEKWASARGYEQLASDTTPDNEKSITAHKALGFKEVERVVCFLKDLDAHNDHS